MTPGGVATHVVRSGVGLPRIIFGAAIVKRHEYLDVLYVIGLDDPTVVCRARELAKRLATVLASERKRGSSPCCTAARAGKPDAADCKGSPSSSPSKGHEKPITAEDILSQVCFCMKA